MQIILHPWSLSLTYSKYIHIITSDYSTLSFNGSAQTKPVPLPLTLTPAIPQTTSRHTDTNTDTRATMACRFPIDGAPGDPEMQKNLRATIKKVHEQGHHYDFPWIAKDESTLLSHLGPLT